MHGKPKRVPFSNAIRAGIFKGSPLVCLSMHDLKEGESEFHVIWDTLDSSAALKRMELERPDLLTLDALMPSLNGLEYVKELIGTKPLPVIICSGHTAKGGSKALETVVAGAMDIIEKPKLGTNKFLKNANGHFKNGQDRTIT